MRFREIRPARFGQSIVASLILACVATVAAHAPVTRQQTVPEWIWYAAPDDVDMPAGRKSLTTRFTPESRVVTATVTVVCDHCGGELHLNERNVASLEPFSPMRQIDVTADIHRGANVLRFSGHEADGPAAVAMLLEWTDADGRVGKVMTNDRWVAALDEGVIEPDANGSPPRSARSMGAVAAPLFDSARTGIEINVADDYTQWKRAINSGSGTAPSTFAVPDGFEVELIRSALPAEDSWVAMTEDANGRWIIAREKKGLLRMTLADQADGEVSVEVINEDLAECRGLLFVDGDLFAMANNDKALFRLRDTIDDDQFDEVIELASIKGDVGHGRNQLVLGPDGLIYGVFGDAVFEPAHATVIVPSIYGPTDVEMTRSGFVARTDGEGRSWEVVVRGLRNPYGIAFNADGEMFTYDADAEFDMGASWYRPTRMLHLLPGGDYRWRRVTQSWPPYFPDQADMPPVLQDIGKGSPTSVVAGRGGRFPWPYDRAIFAQDWAYGRILAIHLEPHGASYRATAETFLRGRPLNVTDVEFGADGAMYFVTGGRGTQSALYRVDYVGAKVAEPDPTPQQLRRRSQAERSRHRLKQWNSLLGEKRSTVADPLWDALAQEDPTLRHAARTVLESVPASVWREHVLTLDPNHGDPMDLALAGWVALLRVGDVSDDLEVLNRVAQLDLGSLGPRQWREVLFIVERCLSRASSGAGEGGDSLIAQLESLYPLNHPDGNLRLSLLLSNFGAADDFVAKTMDLLIASTTQNERFHYLFVLRHRTQGWTDELRGLYFDEMQRSRRFIAGEGMPTFLRQIRQEALATVHESERDRFVRRLESNAPADSELTRTPARPLVKQWKLADIEQMLPLDPAERDLDNGREMFREARCNACHRLGNQGGVLGPDLTSLARRFSVRDMLVSLVEPSRIVADKYRSETFVLEDGRVLTGRVVLGDYRSESVQIMPDLLDPDQVVQFSKVDIESHEHSEVSAMPTGLLDTLNRDDILDLLAYLRGGDFGE